jgi:predicted transcriptional regulator
MPAPTSKPLDDLGDLQRTVLETLWNRGPSTVQEVRDALEAERPLAYTTILTTLQNLQRAGWVLPEPRGRAHVYSPTRSRSQAGAASLRSFIKRTFAGDPALLLQTLIEHERLSPKDLARIRAMIDAKKKESRNA